MYHAKIWDEDKWNIHSKSYSSAKYSASSSADKDMRLYHEQKYGSQEKNSSSDYHKKEETLEKEKRADAEDLKAFEQKKEPDEKEEEIVVKAAKQLFSEKKFNSKNKAVKAEFSTIDDAINRAISQEKKVIIMDS